MGIYRAQFDMMLFRYVHTEKSMEISTDLPTESDSNSIARQQFYSCDSYV